MLSIKVLGPGCVNCYTVRDLAARVLETLDVDATIQHVSDPREWQKYSVLMTPGLVINNKLVCAGHIPSEAEVTRWITNALAAG
jgi:small redox-active disulfide protein 2